MKQYKEENPSTHGSSSETTPAYRLKSIKISMSQTLLRYLKAIKGPEISHLSYMNRQDGKNAHQNYLRNRYGYQKINYSKNCTKLVIPQTPHLDKKTKDTHKKNAIKNINALEGLYSAHHQEQRFLTEDLISSLFTEAFSQFQDTIRSVLHQFSYLFFKLFTKNASELNPKTAIQYYKHVLLNLQLAINASDPGDLAAATLTNFLRRTPTNQKDNKIIIARMHALLHFMYDIVEAHQKTINRFKNLHHETINLDKQELYDLYFDNTLKQLFTSLHSLTALWYHLPSALLNRLFHTILSKPDVLKKRDTSNNFMN